MAHHLLVYLQLDPQVIRAYINKQTSIRDGRHGRPSTCHAPYTHTFRTRRRGSERSRGPRGRGKASFFSCVAKNMRRICICIHTRIHAASDVRVKIISSHDDLTASTQHPFHACLLAGAHLLTTQLVRRSQQAKQTAWREMDVRRHRRVDGRSVQGRLLAPEEAVSSDMIASCLHPSQISLLSVATYSYKPRHRAVDLQAIHSMHPSIHAFVC